MWHIFLDALKDSAIALPFLLVIYLFIEFLERNKRAKQNTVRLLNGKLAPLVAGGVGLVPQCGFSVMATDLYCQNYLKLGTLIAFFVATSDEALPILLTNVKTVKVVWVVLLVKVLYAVALGYFVNLLDRRVLSAHYQLREEGCCHHSFNEETQDGDHSHDDEQHEHDDNVDGQQHGEQNGEAVADDNVDAQQHEHSEATNKTCPRGERCGEPNTDEYSERQQQQPTAKTNSRPADKAWNFVKHPLLHTLKIFVYIFAVNAIFGILLYYAQEPITDFTAQLGFFQCFFTAALGLIPNCASSVIIAGMYTGGIVKLSAMLAGLVSNSGIALAILFKQRGKLKRNFLILGIMYLAGVALGVATYFLFPLFGLN